MTTLADRFAVHSFVGDYEAPNQEITSRQRTRVRALAILVDDDESLPPTSVLTRKVQELEDQDMEEAMDGEDSITNRLLSTYLYKKMLGFGKRFVSAVFRYSWRAFKFLARTAVRWLIRGLLMPLAGIVVGALGLPATVALAIGGTLAYAAYWLTGNKGLPGHIFRQTFGLEPEPTATLYAPRTEGPAVSNQTRYAGAPITQGATPAAAKEAVSNAPSDLVETGKANVHTAGNVDLAGMNPGFMQLFYAMVGDYVTNGGGHSIMVTSGYRSIQKQEVLYAAYLARGKTGYPVAHPGGSRHQSGVAIDVSSSDAYQLEASGYLAKYHFLRPIRSDPVHIENTLFRIRRSAPASQVAVADKEDHHHGDKENTTAATPPVKVALKEVEIPKVEEPSVSSPGPTDSVVPVSPDNQTVHMSNTYIMHDGYVVRG